MLVFHVRWVWVSRALVWRWSGYASFELGVSFATRCICLCFRPGIKTSLSSCQTWQLAAARYLGFVDAQ